jgi:hypothetical protein
MRFILTTVLVMIKLTIRQGPQTARLLYNLWRRWREGRSHPMENNLSLEPVATRKLLALVLQSTVA